MGQSDLAGKVSTCSFYFSLFFHSPLLSLAATSALLWVVLHTPMEMILSSTIPLLFLLRSVLLLWPMYSHGPLLLCLLVLFPDISPILRYPIHLLLLLTMWPLSATSMTLSLSAGLTLSTTTLCMPLCMSQAMCTMCLLRTAP